MDNVAVVVLDTLQYDEFVGDPKVRLHDLHADLDIRSVEDEPVPESIRQRLKNQGYA
jgi:hypothetical protein